MCHIMFINMPYYSIALQTRMVECRRSHLPVILGGRE